jgi:hypothetical protein
MDSKWLLVIVTAVITATITTGVIYWTQNPTAENPNVESVTTYSNEQYSLDYPQGYTVIQATESFPALTIKKSDNQRLEIFKMSDFGDRPFGFEGNETEQEIDGYVPKESLTIGSDDKKFDVWLFYPTGNEDAKNELQQILESIETN